MNLLICPGIHTSDLTRCFLAQLQAEVQAQAADVAQHFQWHVLPSHLPPYSPDHVSNHFKGVLGHECGNAESGDAAVWIAFSAGVVGAIATARSWQRDLSANPRTVAFIAFDGWGVPLAGDFPIIRFSHDRFTAQTSEWPQKSQASFYADPDVEHLELWRSPQTVQGWWQENGASGAFKASKPVPMTAAAALAQQLLKLQAQM